MNLDLLKHKFDILILLVLIIMLVTVLFHLENNKDLALAAFSLLSASVGALVNMLTGRPNIERKTDVESHNNTRV